MLHVLTCCAWHARCAPSLPPHLCDLISACVQYLTTSKADALIEDLRQLKQEDPESKVLIFR